MLNCTIQVPIEAAERRNRLYPVGSAMLDGGDIWRVMHTLLVHGTRVRGEYTYTNERLRYGIGTNETEQYC